MRARAAAKVPSQAEPEGDYRQERLFLNIGALEQDGLRRGLTAQLFLLPYTEDWRVFVLRWYRRDNFLCELIHAGCARTLFGYDEPGIYDLWVTPAPPNSPASFEEDDLIEGVRPDAEGKLHITKTFVADTPALSRDARQRGVTATLFLLRYGEDARCVVYLGHISRTVLYEIVPVAGCDALFGCSDPGAYDVRVARAPHDPGLPVGAEKGGDLP
jgi:hypothetical protein